MTKRLQLIIRGNNVQRCGFRKCATDMARNLELSGSAMYIDQDILIEIEGEASRVEKFVSWAQIGPSECNISEVEEKELPIAGETSFQLVHGVTSRKQRQATS